MAGVIPDITELVIAIATAELAAERRRERIKQLQEELNELSQMELRAEEHNGVWTALRYALRPAIDDLKLVL